MSSKCLIDERATKSGKKNKTQIVTIKNDIAILLQRLKLKTEAEISITIFNLIAELACATDKRISQVFSIMPLNSSLQHQFQTLRAGREVSLMNPGNSLY